MDKYKNGFLQILQRYIDGKSRPEEKPLMDLWYDATDRESVESEENLVLRGVDERMWDKIQSGKTTGTDESAPVMVRWWGSAF